MEMSHVRYFLALCKERSFTRAAKQCGVAQPSLTQSIKLLEMELGAPLFFRQQKGTELTEFGQAAKPHFEAIDRCINEIKRAMQPVSARDRRLANGMARRRGLHRRPKRQRRSDSSSTGVDDARNKLDPA
jgi:DNA-binding transcriptional LysR family regulator